MFNSRRLRALTIGAVVGLVVIASSAHYAVKPGDTLGEIAAANGTTISKLAESNGITNVDLIRVGQQLAIPGQDDTGQVHVVEPGETLGEIAAKYQSSVSALAKANNLANPNVIAIGTKLSIPIGASPGSPATVITHVVKPGESLALIAAKYGTTVETIAELNGITNPSVIYTGTSLTVQGTPPPKSVGETTGIHVVKAGETLGKIAAAYGISVAELVEANELADPNQIVVGAELRVPGGTGGSGGAGIVCPLEGATYFNDWGFPRAGEKFHQGNDLFAPRGTKVRAPVSGDVIDRVGEIGGLQFWLTGNDGNLYIGTHLDGFGQAGTVDAGDVIGYVGDSGNARGSDTHLHFEILVNGTPINPYPILTAAGC